MGIRAASSRIRDYSDRRVIVRALAWRSRAPEVWHGASDSAQWPDCPFCEQSPTGSYNQRTVCVRCSSRTEAQRMKIIARRSTFAILAPRMGSRPSALHPLGPAKTGDESDARFELTDKGKAEVESDAMAFLRRRIKLSERLSLIEQAHWQRSRHEDTDSSSAQPHRFGSAC
jgi:hypothetical protein